MGFSHHWRISAAIPAEDWSAICESVAFLVEDFNREFGSSIELPVPNYVSIYIDADRWGCEHMRVLRRPTERWNSCKTLHMPYDKLVISVIAVVAAHHAATEVDSDGLQSHWQPCLDWAGAVLGREIPMPDGIRITGADPA